MKALLLIILAVIALSFVFVAHRKALKTCYRYRWAMLSIAYPFIYLHYRERLKYLSQSELETVIDKLVMQRDSWFIRRLLNLTVYYRLRLGDYNV